jgi:hypothetical protein
MSDTQPVRVTVARNRAHLEQLARRRQLFPNTHHPPTCVMSLADELLADFGSDEDVSDHETPAALTSSAVAGGSKPKPSSGGGLMLPPSSLPQKRKALEDSLDAQPSTSGSSNLADDLMGSDDDEDEEMDAGGMELPAGGVKPTEELDKEVVEQMDLSDVKEVSKVAKLLGSRKLEEVLKVCPPFQLNMSCLGVGTTKLTELVRDLLSARTSLTSPPTRRPRI